MILYLGQGELNDNGKLAYKNGHQIKLNHFWFQLNDSIRKAWMVIFEGKLLKNRYSKEYESYLKMWQVYMATEAMPLARIWRAIIRDNPSHFPLFKLNPKWQDFVDHMAEEEIKDIDLFFEKCNKYFRHGEVR